MLKKFFDKAIPVTVGLIVFIAIPIAGLFLAAKQAQDFKSNIIKNKTHYETHYRKSWE